MIPKIIHQSWKTKDISKAYDPRWIESWKRNFPDWEYRLWTDEDNLNLVKTVHPSMLKTYTSYDLDIKRADSVRYLYMYHIGGLYVDLDFECLKSFEHLLDNGIVLGSIDESYDYFTEDVASGRIPNALMASEPGHPFWKFAIEQLAGKERHAVYDATGPVFLTRCIMDYVKKNGPSNIKVYGRRYFYQIDWRKREGQVLRKQFLENYPTIEKVQTAFPKAYAVTYWTHNYQA